MSDGLCLAICIYIAVYMHKISLWESWETVLSDLTLIFLNFILKIAIESLFIVTPGSSLYLNESVLFQPGVCFFLPPVPPQLDLPCDLLHCVPPSLEVPYCFGPFQSFNVDLEILLARHALVQRFWQPNLLQVIPAARDL